MICPAWIALSRVHSAYCINNTMKLSCPAWTALSEVHPGAYVPSWSSLQFQIETQRWIKLYNHNFGFKGIERTFSHIVSLVTQYFNFIFLDSDVNCD